MTIEDDDTTALEIVRILVDQGYEVDRVEDGAEGLRLALSENYDAITLDRRLPGLDGLEVATRLKSAGSETPILMISGLFDVDERVKGLRAGGDDYLVKPFALEEMVARVEVLLRRSRSNLGKLVLRYADLELDLVTHIARRGGEDLRLYPKEFKLLEMLVRNAEQTMTRTMIFETVWGYTFDPGTNLIDVHIGTLRKKLEGPGQAPLLHTVRGAGYRLGPEV